MANIIPLKDNTGAQFYPQTHEKAVVDSNGVNLQTKLASITTPTYVTAWDGASTPVVANIPAGVTVTYNTTSYTGTLAASASTANKTYLVSTGTTDNYNRYVTQLNGSTYSWQNLGSTEIDLSDYATKAELGQLDQKVDDKTNIAVPLSGTWRQGSLTSNHAYTSANANRIIMAVQFDKHLSFNVASGYYASVHCYSGSYTDINQISTAAAGATWLGNIDNGWKEGSVSVAPLSGTKTYVIVVKHGSAGTDKVLPSAGETAVLNLKGITPVTESIPEMKQNIQDLQEYDACKFIGKDNTYQISLFKRNIIPGEKYRVYLTDKNYLRNNVTGTGAYIFNINSYDSQGVETALAGTLVGGTIPDYYEFTVPADSKYIRIGGRANNGVIVAYDIVKVQVGAVAQTDYVIMADMVRKSVQVTRTGSLKYNQAFCVYDGKYYSTNGSYIAEQGSDFSVLRDVVINAGHGNSLQLVSGGKAWVSGWEDQKMYKIDLTTLTVESFITLPTTGYTTAAVDEANGLMYIFQRTSYPDTIEAYNFIVYDYVNQEVKSTRVIETFAAMQAVDYYQGKILMLFGFGTVAAPSGMRVYNTVGDVLADYTLSIFASTEPEGIMFERDTKTLLVSDTSKNLYTVV